MHINFLAASRIQAAIECLPRTCADDHNDRYLAGKGEIEMSTFTPGPWTHRNGRIFQTDYEVLTIANVARAGDGDYSPANGNLLADAPAMLDLIERMLVDSEYLASWLEREIGVGLSLKELEEAGRLDREVIEARALIAKHRGGK